MLKSISNAYQKGSDRNKMRQKRILFVNGSLARGGSETVLVNISNALVKRGYHVTILCYSSNRIDLLENLDKRVRYIFKKQREFNIRSRIPYIKRFYNTRKSSWERRVSASRLYQYYVGKEKYDVEVGFYRGPAIKIVSGSSNKNSIKCAWVHTDFKLCDKRSILEWFSNMDEVKSAYQKMDKVVCVSKQAKENFIDVIGLDRNVTAIYNMIPVKQIISKSYEICPQKKRKFTLISVGRLIQDKRQDRLLIATKMLLTEGFDFDVWIVGSGREEERLKHFCVENKLDNVFFLGMQNNPYKYMRQADLFVLSSQREGFAIAIPEAMACGLPVLSAKCTGPTEILNNGEYGILAENSTKGIYESLKKVLINPIVLEYFKEQSRKRYIAFDEDVIINDIIKLFD